MPKRKMAVPNSVAYILDRLPTHLPGGLTPAAPSFGLLAWETVTLPLPVTGAFFIEVVDDGGFAATPAGPGGLTPAAPSLGRLASEMVFLPLVTPLSLIHI